MKSIATHGGEVASKVRPRRPRLGAKTKGSWQCVGVEEMTGAMARKMDRGKKEKWGEVE